MRAIRLLTPALLLAIAPACDRAAPTGAGDTPKAGAREISALEIARSDPHTGQSWAVKIERAAPPRRSGDPGDWRLASSPLGEVLSDLRADSTFVFHLVDVLHSIRLPEAGGGSEKRALSELGLDPPRWALRWRSPSGGRELRLGDETPDRSGVYAVEGATGSIRVARGPVLGLLQRIEAPDHLRLRGLSPHVPDDVVEFRILEVRPGGASRETFFAERQGGGWVGRGGRPLPVNAGRGLVRLLGAEIRSFVDDPGAAAGIRARLAGTPGYRLSYRLRREARDSVLAFGAWEGRVFATADARPEGAFELSPSVLALLRPGPAW